MEKSLKFWYHHIFRSVKAKIKGLEELRRMGAISFDKYAEGVQEAVDTFDRRTEDFINQYVNEGDKPKFRRLIEQLSQPKMSWWFKILHFLGL
jgi:hypothetical protein